ncbi:hypothetical protein HXX76_011172 [Chlamydomonas incerta]|uniref:Uncharacterized protein n=1 Tax=Chlamydomonas incerta TaxID=51695 RepID=A0A835SSM5_CHLIN|nr:hypothetical protein HXX76_011172 [Chlamydomonas incerta]|eukprot:KAG2428928.1 hypothetical protein HXX76_011172 [Chlamydomonas incerta]
MRDIVALASSSKDLNRVASSRRVWVDLLQRAFSEDERPRDMSAVLGGTAPELRAAYRLLSLQRPAFLSDAPRTSGILEHTGSRFRQVLHIDGRRDLNFSTVVHGVPPGQYAVVWRLQLQSGFVRGYCNFRAVFSRPRSSSGGSSSGRGGGAAARGSGKGRAKGLQLKQLMRHRREQGLELEGPQQQAALEKRLQRRLRGWLPTGCMSGPAVVAAEAPADGVVLEQLAAHPQGLQQADGADRSVRRGAAQAGMGAESTAAVVPPPPAAGPVAQPPTQAAHPEIEIEPFADVPQAPAHLQPLPLQPLQQQAPPLQPAQQQPLPPPPPPQLAQAIGQLNRASVKRDAACAAGGAGGPRYVHKLLAPLWGGHSSSWRQLDPAGPLGHGGWRRLNMGSLTVRRGADVHLHSVLVQLRPVGAAALAAALPEGEDRWRGVLVDYVELVPLCRPGLLESFLPEVLLPARRCGFGLGGCSGRPPTAAPDTASGMAGRSSSNGGSGGAKAAVGAYPDDPEMVYVPAL